MSAPPPSIKTSLSAIIPTILIATIFINADHVFIKSTILLGAIAIDSGRKIESYIDLNFTTITLFMLTYFLLSMVDASSKTPFSPSLILLPPLLYIAGNWIYSKCNSPNAVITPVFHVGAALAYVGVISLIENLTAYGFEGGSRSVEITTSGFALSATVIAGTLVILTAFGGVLFSEVGNSRKLYFAAGFLLSIIMAFRLGSRTILALSIISLIAGYLFNSRKISTPRAILIFIIALLVGSNLYEDMQSQFSILSYFQDRIDDSRYGLGTAGGRTENWAIAIALIPSSPFGWSFDEGAYAHNFWLDVARNSGWIGLLGSIFLTSLFAKTSRKAMRINQNGRPFLTMTLCINCCIFGIFMIEPILDGFIYLFCFSCFFWGVMNASTRKRSTKYN